jgi:hypothetical protein
MNIGLDYDETYTRDPELWNGLITHARMRGHMIYVVTMRADSIEERVPPHVAMRVHGVYYTDRRAKRDFMTRRGILIDVWIDDCPVFVDTSASPLRAAENAQVGLWSEKSAH